MILQLRDRLKPDPIPARAQKAAIAGACFEPRLYVYFLLRITFGSSQEKT